MKRYLPIFTLVLCVTSIATGAWAQHRQTHPLLQGPQYPFPSEEILRTALPSLANNGGNGLQVQNQRGKTSARTSGTSKLPLGYTHEKWDTDLHSFKTAQRKIVAFSEHEVFKMYTVKQSDTITIDELTMTPDFSNGDILDFILDINYDQTKVAQNTVFLRPVRGEFHQKILELVTREKVNGSFITSEYRRDRKAFSSLFLMGSLFHTIRNCGAYGYYEITSTGSIENNLWQVEQLIVRKDCNTNAILGEQKWIVVLNANFQRVEDKYYIKQNGSYQLFDHFKWEYDEQNREKSYVSVLDNKKYEYEYDEFGTIMNGYKWNGSEWIQDIRTIREIVQEAGKTIITYTSQWLKNDVWGNYYREVRHLDSQNRTTFFSTEYYNSNSPQLLMGFYAKIKYNENNLMAEREDYSYDGIGTKEVYTYNDKGEVVMIESLKCANQLNCENGIYEPYTKIEYSYGVIDTLDYQRSFAYTEGNWHKSDSLANVYDKDGDLVEMYVEKFTSDERERIRINYKQNLVTAVDENEPVTITLYPNPTDHELKVETQLAEYTLSIFDLNGKLLGRYVNPEVINISAHPDGVCIILIEARGKRYYQKIVKR